MVAAFDKILLNVELPDCACRVQREEANHPHEDQLPLHLHCTFV
ncbi:hypothetical protein C5167_004922 [Papaver somniferum]|uniref:Uncharacterized protein n=1 Tax=Papaver somniferum TaxID=3469 RepID=A0A4Y7JCY9_PAPSO|nr:hypothetical protein C5167_004922 [Papaver somniferum]